MSAGDESDDDAEHDGQRDDVFDDVYGQHYSNGGGGGGGNDGDGTAGGAFAGEDNGSLEYDYYQEEGDNNTAAGDDGGGGGGGDGTDGIDIYGDVDEGMDLDAGQPAAAGGQQHLQQEQQQQRPGSAGGLKGGRHPGNLALRGGGGRSHSPSRNDNRWGGEDEDALGEPGEAGFFCSRPVFPRAASTQSIHSFLMSDRLGAFGPASSGEVSTCTDQPISFATASCRCSAREADLVFRGSAANNHKHDMGNLFPCRASINGETTVDHTDCSCQLQTCGLKDRYFETWIAG